MDLTRMYPLRILSAMDGSELKQIRKKLGFTQEQLAEQLGVHWNSIARQERGEIGIRESQARLLRLLLGQSKRGGMKATKKEGR
jgi:predicted transcriptional regulator